jgi:hypothetical protein
MICKTHCSELLQACKILGECVFLHECAQNPKAQRELSLVSDLRSVSTIFFKYNKKRKGVIIGMVSKQHQNAALSALDGKLKSKRNRFIVKRGPKPAASAKASEEAKRSLVFHDRWKELLNNEPQQNFHY